MCRHGAVMRLTKKRKTNSGGAPLEIGVEGNLPRRLPAARRAAAEAAPPAPAAPAEGDDSSAPDWSVVDEDHFLETVPGGDISGDDGVV
jgi:hypothetical protein